MFVRFGRISLAAVLLAAPAAHAETPVAPAEAGLAMAGTLASGLRLAWRLDYVTTVPLARCQFLDDVTGLTIARIRTETAVSEVASGRHKAIIALERLDEPECGWALRTVYACVARAADAGEGPGNCIPLLVSGAAEPGARKMRLAIDCSTSRACTLTDAAFQPRRFEGRPQDWTIDFDMVTPVAPVPSTAEYDGVPGALAGARAREDDRQGPRRRAAGS